MPRYFFDILDRIDCPDEYGSELPNMGAALTLACASVGEILSDASRSGRAARCIATVRDEAGATLFTATAALTIKMA